MASRSASVSVSPVRRQRSAPRSKSVVASSTPVPSRTAARTLSPSGTTSLPMPSPGITASLTVCFCTWIMSRPYAVHPSSEMRVPNGGPLGGADHHPGCGAVTQTLRATPSHRVRSSSAPRSPRSVRFTAASPGSRTERASPRTRGPVDLVIGRLPVALLPLIETSGHARTVVEIEPTSSTPSMARMALGSKDKNHHEAISDAPQPRSRRKAGRMGSSRDSILRGARDSRTTPRCGATPSASLAEISIS